MELHTCDCSSKGSQTCEEKELAGKEWACQVQRVSCNKAGRKYDL